jgi:hypothetical protein
MMLFLGLIIGLITSIRLLLVRCLLMTMHLVSLITNGRIGLGLIGSLILITLIISMIFTMGLILIL